MTEHHRYVDADAERLTQGDFVEHVAHAEHPAHKAHADAGPAPGETGEDPDAATAQEPRQ